MNHFSCDVFDTEICDELSAIYLLFINIIIILYYYIYITLQEHLVLIIGCDASV